MRRGEEGKKVYAAGVRTGATVPRGSLGVGFGQVSSVSVGLQSAHNTVEGSLAVGAGRQGRLTEVGVGFRSGEGEVHVYR